MFFRIKPSGTRRYLQVVENYWDQGRARQRVLVTLGRLEHLQESGQLDALLASGGRLAQNLLILGAHQKGEAPVVRTRRLGPALVFERLWQETGCAPVVKQLVRDRRFAFDVERAVFLTVLHRLCAPGSDRAAERWKEDQEIVGVADLELHQLYRAMAWLGSAKYCPTATCTTRPSSCRAAPRT
jgi:hypothetical protein